MSRFFYHPFYAAPIRWFWIIALGFILVFGTLFTITAMGLLGNLPEITELENPKSSLATEVISSDGVVLGKYYIQNRSQESYTTLSPNLIQALIATEDVRFYEHSGIDFQSVFTAFFYNLAGKKRGASTITQQLAKNMFPRTRFGNVISKTVTKLKEWVVAVQLEKRYTKEEILTLYLNTVQFAGNAYGIKSAAKVFFNKTPIELNIGESATLVGMLKGIGAYNPVRNYDRALGRRNTVLAQMTKYGKLSPQEAEKWKKLPIDLNMNQDDHTDGMATYFREHLRQEAEAIAREKGYDIYKDGLKIYTTIDSKMQAHAESAVLEHMEKLQNQFFKHWKGKKPAKDALDDILNQAMKNTERYRRLKAAKADEKTMEAEFAKKVKMKVWTYQGYRDTLLSPRDSILYYKMFLLTGLCAIDPHLGAVKAWVGGPNYTVFKYDHVNYKATRQVGSTFKPFVYTLAVDNGYSPCTKVPNQPVVFEEFENWSPNNSDFRLGGELTLYRGLALSVNNVVAYLLKQLGKEGPSQVINLARKMGIQGKLEPYPSICLGVFDLSVFEMTSAFATFSNRGVWTEPYYLEKITDRNGAIVYSAPERKTQEAMSEQTAFIMLKLMEGVVQYGTGYEVKAKYKVKGAVAGKTGTTQNNSDGWFMGVTPNLACGVWTGCEDMKIAFRSTDLGSGANMSLPAFGLFLKKVQEDARIKIEFPEQFVPPDKKLTLEIDCQKFEGEEEDEGFGNE